MTIRLSTALLPITALSGVGSQLGTKLAQLGIVRVFDALLHLPKDYEDKSQITPIAAVEHGMSCLVAGKIVRVDQKNGLSAILADSTGSITLKFFKTYPALIQHMYVGQYITAFGEVKISPFGIQIAHPEYRTAEQKPLEQGILPIYPTVSGLHQNKLRQIIRLALQAVSTDGLVGLERFYLDQPALRYPLIQALYAIHIPDPEKYGDQCIFQLKQRTHLAYRRLVVEELTAHQLTFALRRHQIHQATAPAFVQNSLLAQNLIASLPFALTRAQNRVIQECTNDMRTPKPMLRLVQGDVGAGKTLVAAVCACHALESGYQVAIMAPTEILAKQHFANFQHWFAPLGIQVALLVGKQNSKARKNTLTQIQDGSAQIVVGTHALFSDGVQFAQLGLVVVDEQHRFGVEQRLKLSDKSNRIQAHQMFMSATPIPRTLAMSVYGDMDICIIDELPPGRTPITTVAISRDRRDEVLERIQVNCKQGKQAYWICPLVEESENPNAQSAELMYQDISQRLSIRVGLVHGKMKTEAKNSVMHAFKQGEIDLLIATTVVEVGVDVPNASLMIIENAERLGLSQLHQLRGRVGRGAVQSFCVLLYQPPLSQTGSERLAIIQNSTDGFVIAQKDLQMRGAGELLGTRQAGDMGYYIADIVQDEAELEIAQNVSQIILQNPENHALAQDFIRLWLKNNASYINA